MNRPPISGSLRDSRCSSVAAVAQRAPVNAVLPSTGLKRSWAWNPLRWGSGMPVCCARSCPLRPSRPSRPSWAGCYSCDSGWELQQQQRQLCWTAGGSQRACPLSLPVSCCGISASSSCAQRCALQPVADVQGCAVQLRGGIRAEGKMRRVCCGG